MKETDQLWKLLNPVDQEYEGNLEENASIKPNQASGNRK